MRKDVKEEESDKSKSKIKIEYIIRGNYFLLQGGSTGLRFFEKVFKTELLARKELNRIKNFIKAQKRDMDKKTIILSDKENEFHKNNDTICRCYWNIIGLFKKTEKTLLN